MYASKEFRSSLSLETMRRGLHFEALMIAFFDMIQSITRRIVLLRWDYV